MVSFRPANLLIPYRRNRDPLLSGRTVDGIRQNQCLPAVPSAAGRLPTFQHAIQKICPFIMERFVRALELAPLFLRPGAELPSAAPTQAFGAVSSTESLDGEGPLFTRNLKKEGRLPLRPTCMQRGHTSIGCMQQGEDVVFQWSDGPKRGRGAGFHLGKAAREPAEQIQGMNPLIEKLPTSGGLRLSTPFLLVPAPAPVSIHAAQEMQPAERAFFEQRVRLGQRRVVTMVVAHL